MTDILTLVGGGGGGGGTVTSATSPLNINSGVLSLNLSGICTAATSPLTLTNGQMTIDLTSYSNTTQMNAAISLGLAPYVLTTTLGSYSTTSQVNSLITNALTSYVSSTALTNALAAYTDTTSLNALLAAKMDTLTAGTGISIAGSTISSTHTPIILQLDGTTQAGATTLNFVGNTASFTNNVVNISRQSWQDALTLRYSSSASDKNLTQGSAGELLWNGSEVQLKQNAFQQINVVAPLTVSGSNAITIDTLWKPSVVTVGTGLQAIASDANGTLQLDLTGTESRSQLYLIDSQSVVRSLLSSVSGGLVWNGSTLVDLTYLTNNYTTTTGLTTLLSSYVLSSTLASYSTTAQMNGALTAKQDTLTAGTNITISGNTISATGATQAWVTANFLSPLNPGTVGVTQGLSSVMTANTFVISVDETTDSRTQFILRDSNNTARNITANTSGKLLFDTTPLATEAHVTTQLSTKQDTLDYYAESGTGSTTILQGYDTQTPVSLHVSWNYNRR